MKKISSFLASLLVSLNLAAVPAKPVTRTITLSDGTTVQATLRGDETFHFYAAADGRRFIANADGTFRTVSPDEVSNSWAQRVAARNQHRAARIQARRNAPFYSKSRLNSAYTGNKRGLVILVNFKDKAMTHTQSEFNEQFNTVGYNKNKHYGSVRDYFLSQSYNKLTIDFDVVGPYTLKNNMSYYGANDSNGDDLRPGDMIVEACQAADAEVNFNDYDWDGDGEVDQVYVIYAGFGEAQGAPASTIWPHEWQLSEAAGSTLKLDGATIETYACSNELMGTSGTKMDGIGTACHEFSHCLGLPDLYDTANSKNFGMSVWSIMDTGSYNGPSDYEGCVPSAYGAYERIMAGWLDPVELKDPTEISGMKDITDAPEAYIIYNEKNKNEYYLLQNIQQTGWNSYAYGHGMLVVHIDYDADAWYNNTVNNTASHQRCTIIPADNDYGMNYYEDFEGDPYPGYTNNTSLTNTSKPAAKLFNANTDGKKFMNKPIEDIAESTNGLISFTFNGGAAANIPVPVANAATNVTANGFTASWSAVDGAQSYTIEINEVSEQAATVLLKEDFAGFATQTAAGTDWGEKHTLDQVLSTSGWTGSKVYTGTDNYGTNGVKLGSSKSSGYLITPAISAPTSGNVTIYVEAAPYGNESSTKLTVTTKTTGGTTLGMETVNVDGESAFAIHVSDITSDIKVTFGTSKPTRAYISYICIIDGYAEDEDIDAIISDAKKRSAAPQRANKQTITNVSGTSYTFSNLTAKQYTYRVKAVTAIGESGWSNRVSVELQGGVTPPPTPVTVPTPTITPGDGTYTAPVSVSMSVNGTPGTAYTIYYKLNGGNEQEYTAPFTVSTTTVITAYAQDLQGNKSDIVTRTITIQNDTPTPVTVPTPTITPGDGIYSGSVAVTMSVNGTPGTAYTIYYKLNGSNEQVYTESFVVSVSSVITAYAVDPQGNKSATVTRTITIQQTPQPEKEDAGSAWDYDKVEIKLSEAADYENFFTTSSDGAITYSSSNTAVATIDAQGKVTIVGAGTTVITATTAETDTYKASTTSFTLIVTNDVIDGISAFSDKSAVRQAMTDLSGRRVLSPVKGIYIVNGKKVVIK